MTIGPAAADAVVSQEQSACNHHNAYHVSGANCYLDEKPTSSRWYHLLLLPSIWLIEGSARLFSPTSARKNTQLSRHFSLYWRVVITPTTAWPSAKSSCCTAAAAENCALLYTRGTGYVNCTVWCMQLCVFFFFSLSLYARTSNCDCNLLVALIGSC